MLMDTVGRKCCCWKTPDALRAVFRCFVFRAQHTDGDCIRLCFDAGRFISNDAGSARIVGIMTHVEFHESS